MLKVVEKKKIWFSISAIIIAIGLIAMFAKGLNFGIDFEGGTNIILKFDEEYNKEEVDSIVKGFASDAVTNTAENNEYEIKSKNFESKDVSKLVEELKKKYKMPENAIVSQEEIGASVGKELRVNSLKALAIAFVAMLIYIAVRFEFKFGVIALIALAHDLLITISVFAVFGISINSPFIAAVLTIVGYSINATIVIFDRIRENSKNMRRASATEIANKSLTQTMSRSINTTLTTLIIIIAVNIFVPTVREFTFPLIIGIAAGAYSSICIASPVWVILKDKRGKKSKAELA